jgi:hypothetical protein
MCNIFIPSLDEANLISEAPEELIRLYAPEEIQDIVFYQSYSFVEGTGYVEKVYQEIDFVLKSNQGKCTIEDVDLFIDKWGFADYQFYKISELSGGWKKFLGLALYTNIKQDHKIYFDAFRQLSDRLIHMLISNLEKTETKTAYFFEYDMHLSPYDMQDAIKNTSFDPKEMTVLPKETNF